MEKFMEKNKNEIIVQIAALLSQLVDDNDNHQESSAKKNTESSFEMLTIKECAAAITGLSEHTIRQLVVQKKIPYIRTGNGKRGKILINKATLFDYINNIR